MSTTVQKEESKKPVQKKSPKKAASRRSKKNGDASDGPMPGKKLLQSWVDEEYHDYFTRMAKDAALRPATYLRQLVHRQVDEDRAAKKEMRGNGARS